MNTVEINNLSEPVEPVPMNELSIARYVGPASATLGEVSVIAGDYGGCEIEYIEYEDEEQENGNDEQPENDSDTDTQ